MSIDSLKQSVKADKSAGAPIGEAQMVEIPKFERLLTLWKDEVSRALPVHLSKNMDRFLRVALTEFRVNPTLATCDPRSVFAAVLTAAQMGWEIGGPMGLAYLVPYKGEAQLIPGWKGYVDLVHRSGRGEVWTGAVYDGDDFEYILGARPDLKHVPMGEDDPEKLTHTYSIGWIKDQTHPIVEVWPQVKLLRHRDRYNKVGPKHYSFENWEMYGRKVALLQCVKYLPASVEIGQAMSLDYAHDEGQRQGLTVKNVTDGLIFPVGNGGEHSATVVESKPEEVQPATKPAESVVEKPVEESKEDKAKAEAEVKAKQKEIEEKAKAKAKSEKAAKEEKKAPTPEKVVEKSSASPSPDNKNASSVAEDVPEWAQVATKEEKAPVEEKVAEAAQQAPAPVEIVELPVSTERKLTKYKDIFGVVMPQFVTRLANEPGPTEEQIARANEEMKLINGPTGEATLENTVREWLESELGDLTQDTMEAFVQVLAKFRESRA